MPTTRTQNKDKILKSNDYKQNSSTAGQKKWINLWF